MLERYQKPFNDRYNSYSMATTISLMKGIACKLVILISSAVKAYCPLTSETNEGGVDKDAYKQMFIYLVATKGEALNLSRNSISICTIYLLEGMDFTAQRLCDVTFYLGKDCLLAKRSPQLHQQSGDIYAKRNGMFAKMDGHPF